MSDIFDSETFWLTVTNIILGLVTLVCVVIFGVAGFKEVFERLAHRARIPLAEDSHAFSHAELGITMADGGTRIDQPVKHNRILPLETSDPDNIIRSDN